MKAILVIEMPESCLKCIYCGCKEEDENQKVCLFMSQAYTLTGNLNNRHYLCPLKPMPYKYNEYMTDAEGHLIGINKYCKGRNECIDEILGEE